MNHLALTTGSEFSEWIMVIAGNAFGAILAYRAVVYFFREDWGKLITYAFAAVFVFGFVRFPDQAQSVLGEVWGKVSETSAAPALEKAQQR
ncbi:hypothetical protein [Streptomyces californicus]